ncbi:MAG: hypothetical protein AB8H79_16715 [Myxococcota bacterium]
MFRARARFAAPTLCALFGAPILGGLAGCPAPAPDGLAFQARANCEVTITESMGSTVGFRAYDADGLPSVWEQSVDLDRVPPVRNEYSHRNGLLVRSTVAPSEGGRIEVTNYDYDDLGRLVQRRDRGSTTRWDYDGDLLIRREEARRNSITAVTYTHDAQGRTQTVTETMDEVVDRVLTYTWTDDRVAEVITTVGGSEQRWEVELDEAGRTVKEWIDDGNDGTIDRGFTQEWTDDGRPLRLDWIGGRVQTWDYDTDNRTLEIRDEPFLTRATVEMWEWSCS